jgi:hypothetical protein
VLWVWFHERSGRVCSLKANFSDKEEWDAGAVAGAAAVVLPAAKIDLRRGVSLFPQNVSVKYANGNLFQVNKIKQLNI